MIGIGIKLAFTDTLELSSLSSGLSLAFPAATLKRTLHSRYTTCTTPCTCSSMVQAYNTGGGRGGRWDASVEESTCRA